MYYEMEVAPLTCMKCGRSIAADQVFCEDCLQDMALHPVKPDTPVVLPPRASDPSAKRPVVHHKKLRKPEEIIHTLRSWVIILGVMATVLALAFAMCVTIVLRLMDQQSMDPSAGQNYSTGILDDTAGNN